MPVFPDLERLVAAWESAGESDRLAFLVLHRSEIADLQDFLKRASTTMNDPDLVVVHHWAPWPPYDCNGYPLHDTDKVRFLGAEVVDRANRVWVFGKAIDDFDTPLEEPPPGFDTERLLKLAKVMLEHRN